MSKTYPSSLLQLLTDESEEYLTSPGDIVSGAGAVMPWTVTLPEALGQPAVCLGTACPVGVRDGFQDHVLHAIPAKQPSGCLD